MRAQVPRRGGCHMQHGDDAASAIIGRSRAVCPIAFHNAPGGCLCTGCWLRRLLLPAGSSTVYLPSGGLNCLTIRSLGSWPLRLMTEKTATAARQHWSVDLVVSQWQNDKNHACLLVCASTVGGTTCLTCWMDQPLTACLIWRVGKPWHANDNVLLQPVRHTTRVRHAYHRCQ